MRNPVVDVVWMLADLRDLDLMEPGSIGAQSEQCPEVCPPFVSDPSDSLVQTHKLCAPRQPRRLA
jgi:hypothetical protein